MLSQHDAQRHPYHHPLGSRVIWAVGSPLLDTCSAENFRRVIPMTRMFRSFASSRTPLQDLYRGNAYPKTWCADCLRLEHPVRGGCTLWDGHCGQSESIWALPPPNARRSLVAGRRYREMRSGMEGDEYLHRVGRSQVPQV